MRLFTAIPIPENTKDEITKIIRGRLPVPYINTANLHVTLNFFGELSDKEVSLAKQTFQNSTTDLSRFTVSFKSLEKFRTQIHITIEKTKELMELQKILETKFLAAGFQFQDRTYYPHIKLANMHMDNVMNPQRKLAEFPQNEISQVTFTAESIILYESKLLLHHPKHIPILESELKSGRKI